MAVYKYSEACNGYVKLEVEETSTSEEACNGYVNIKEEETSASEDACNGYVNIKEEETLASEEAYVKIELEETSTFEETYAASIKIENEETSHSEVEIEDGSEQNVSNDRGDRDIHDSLREFSESSLVSDKMGYCLDAQEKKDYMSHLPGESRLRSGKNSRKPKEKRFHCLECGKIFLQFDHLKRHFVLHTGERPFSCNDCGKNFRRDETLRIHRRIHTGEKPFRCKECGRNFTQSNHLKNHLSTHAKKNFKCLDCGKYVRDLVDLKLHIKAHLPPAKPEVQQIPSTNIVGPMLYLLPVPVLSSPAVIQS